MTAGGGRKKEGKDGRKEGGKEGREGMIGSKWKKKSR